MTDEPKKQTSPDMSGYSWITQDVYDGLMERAIKVGHSGETLQVLEVSPELLYERAKQAAYDALVIAPRHQSSLSGQQRAWRRRTRRV